MYIEKLTITHIRSIDRFEMVLDEPAGWHVIIGDNGAGKSTIVRSAALAMLDVDDINGARQNWDDWLSQNQQKGSINVEVRPDGEADGESNLVNNRIELRRESNEPGAQTMLVKVVFRDHYTYTRHVSSGYQEYRPYSPMLTPVSVRADAPDNPTLINNFRAAWFSVAYGPYRRFTGGSPEFESVFRSNPRLGMHLSVFSEGVALTEALTFLRDTYARDLESAQLRGQKTSVITDLKDFINKTGLLPHGTTIDRVELSGIYFKDGNENTISALQMSDGYRSILSMTFELIQQLIRIYGADAVFANVRTGGTTIDLPGVVLIDEIDTHLHPTWQTRIGNWFLQYFPKLQFIVTTHSPLICRACEHGSIWRLTAPGSTEQSGEVTGLDRDRLIYGNVLDAFGTEVFGHEVTQSQKGLGLGKQLAQLNKKSFKGTITETERQEMYELRAKMPTAE